MWGIVPAAGIGSRIQPLAFSKELLPLVPAPGGSVRPKAVAEYLLDRMVEGGVDHICIVISPGKADIVRYFGSTYRSAKLCYVVQEKPEGLCDAVFRALAVVPPDEHAVIGLPDTVWFPRTALTELPDAPLSFLLFPVDEPQHFDAVIADDLGNVREIQVKHGRPDTGWIWGAIKARGDVLRELHTLWCRRDRVDPYLGTLVNDWLENGGCALAVRAGELYLDVGTVSGYRQALELMGSEEELTLPAGG